MMSLESIKALNKERTEIAELEKKTPYFIYDQETIDNMKSFPFPSIGDYDPHGWESVEEVFVDTVSPEHLCHFGAMSVDRFREWLRPGYGYAITECGQFQLYVTKFKRKKYNE